MTLAELVADVAARHAGCIEALGDGDVTCDAARFAAALSVESVAAGLRPFLYHGDGTEYSDEYYAETAAALLGAITEADR